MGCGEGTGAAAWVAVGAGNSSTVTVVVDDGAWTVTVGEAGGPTRPPLNGGGLPDSGLNLRKWVIAPASFAAPLFDAAVTRFFA